MFDNVLLIIGVAIKLERKQNSEINMIKDDNEVSSTIFVFL